MSKKNKGGNAAKAAASKGNLSDKKATEAKVENVNADKAQQVAATAATQEKAPTPPPAEKKPADAPKQEKKQDKKPTQQTANKEKKEPKIPTVIAEEDVEGLRKAGIPANIPIGSNRSSADAKAMLAYVGYQRFINNQEYKEQSPESYANTARSIDAVWLLGMVDIMNEFAERASSGEFICKLPADQVFRLQDVAETLGITLATPKALPGVENDGQLGIDFKSAETIIPEELKEDKSSIDNPPSLDPKDINTVEDLRVVLTYLMRKDRNVATNIVNTVEWYRVYCINNAEKGDDKIKLDDRSVTEWINEIFGIIGTVPLMNGLGRTVYLYTSSQGSPVSAHALLHKHMAPCGWSEDQIAQTLKVLLQENFRYKQKDDEKLKATEDKALRAVIGSIGSDYIDNLFNTIATGVTATEASEKNAQEAALSIAKKQYELVSQNYFPEGNHPTKDEIRMKIGQIINLYRDPMDRLAEYEEGMIAPVEKEYPEAPASEKKN